MATHYGANATAPRIREIKWEGVQMWRPTKAAAHADLANMLRADTKHEARSGRTSDRPYRIERRETGK